MHLNTVITATEKMSGKNEIEPSTFKSHTYVYYCDACKRKKKSPNDLRIG